MKLHLLFFLSHLFFSTQGQISADESERHQLFLVNDFSPVYYGKIFRSDTLDRSSEGWVAVYDQKTHKEVIKVITEEDLQGDEKGVTKEDRKISISNKTLSYKQQDHLVYEDFNFDGVNDFALSSGPFSCYGGSLYKVYVATKKGFVFHEDLTQLAEESCGMFTIDKKKKLIHVSSRAGCCQYGSSEYMVKNNQLYAIRIEEVKYDLPVVLKTVQSWDGHKMTSKTERKAALEQDLTQHVFSFTLEKSNKRVLLLSTEKINLHYLFLNTREEVELAYPLDSPEETAVFHLRTSAESTSLSFFNKGAAYEVYDNKGSGGSVGIKVTVNEKVTVLKGLPSSVKGSLSTLSTAGFDNVKNR